MFVSSDLESGKWLWFGVFATAVDDDCESWRAVVIEGRPSGVVEQIIGWCG